MSTSKLEASFFRLFEEDYHTLSYNFPQIVDYQTKVFKSLEATLS